MALRGEERYSPGVVVRGPERIAENAHHRDVTELSGSLAAATHYKTEATVGFVCADRGSIPHVDPTVFIDLDMAGGGEAGGGVVNTPDAE